MDLGYEALVLVRELYKRGKSGTESINPQPHAGRVLTQRHAHCCLREILVHQEKDQTKHWRHTAFSTRRVGVLSYNTLMQIGQDVS